MGKGRKKKRTHVVPEEEVGQKIPRSFVMAKGQGSRQVSQLVLDMRKVMEPYTASKLKVQHRNVLKDFVHVAGPLGVSHFLVFTASDVATNVRFVKVPRGPTLTFHIPEFCLCGDISATLRKPVSDHLQFMTPPLVILNNFNNELAHHKLMSSYFQNLFPTINIHTVNLSALKRCVLFNYNSESDTVEFRHYHIKVIPAGLSRPIKKLIKTQVPDLCKYTDIADFVMKGNLSESEAEEEDAKVVLPQDLPGRGNLKSEQSSVKLTEVGPRMSFQLVKIEEGFCEGSVLYHGYISKTKKEVKELKRKKVEEKKLKEMRKRQQEVNVERKKEEKEAHRLRCGSSKKKTEGSEADDDREESLEPEEEEERARKLVEKDVDDPDDAEWYRREVGKEPDPEFFATTMKGNRKRQSTPHGYGGQSRGREGSEKKRMKQQSSLVPKGKNSDAKARSSTPSRVAVKQNRSRKTN